MTQFMKLRLTFILIKGKHKIVRNYLLAHNTKHLKKTMLLENEQHFPPSKHRYVMYSLFTIRIHCVSKLTKSHLKEKELVGKRL